MRVVRWANTLTAMFCVYIAFTFGTETPSPIEWVIVMMSVGLIFAGGNALNDYLDAETDKISHPERPIPSGGLKRKSVRDVGIILISAGSATAIAGALFHGILPSAIAVSAAAILTLYNLYLKRIPLLGNLTIAILGGAVFIYAGAAQGLAVGHYYAACFAFLFHVSREIIKDISDLPGDESAGIFTLPSKIGVKKSSKIAVALLLFIVPLSIVPYFDKTFSLWYLGAVILFVDLPISLFAWIIPQSTAPRQSMKIAGDLKWIMLGGLFSLLIGGLTS